ncbi:karyopherin [Coemansia thaxteri]|nr:karyopherin [Coemansia thaxteri]
MVRGSDQARRLAAEALETVAKRSAASGEDRDTVLRQLAQDTDALSAIAQAYATTLPPAVDDAWEDAAEALAVARTIAQTGANLVTTHWARKKADETTASRALDRPQQLVELLVALARDPRYTVAAPALGAWGAILRHSAVARDPVVAGVFSVLTEHATAALFSVCRASHEPRLLDLMDPHEADLFESVGDARAFLATEIRAKLLGVVRGMCQLDPAGFVAWIHASLASALGPASPGEVVEAALMIVDAILAALDDLEQRALEDSDAGALASLQAARTPCYALGQRVVGLITCDANSSQLTVRQLATLPALAVLVRPSAVADAGGPARQLLLGMLQKCAACLHPSDQPVGKSPGDGALVAKRASAALVRLATAVPDSLMLVYADLAQLVHSRVTDPGAPRAVKAYLREFQLALIAGASTCTVAERRALARPIIEPMAQELADLADASMHAPGALAELLGLPLADHLCAHPGSDLREQLAAARVGRWRAVGVVSVLAVCMGRTLGGAMGCADLAPVWAEYSAGLVRALLAVVRCIHALWAQWPALPWQSAQAREALFGIVSPTGTPADSTAADAQGALTELRTRAYHCLGRLMSVPALFAGAEGSEPAQSSELAQSFAACVFGDAESLAPRHWHLLLTALASPALRAVGNWPGQDVASRREQSLEAVRRFVPPWLDPLLLFSSERLATQWHDLSAAAARRDEADEIAHENALREWTRSWSLLLADLLRAALVWIPDAARIEHDLASAARISPAAAQSAEHGNGALGLYLLGSQDALAGALTACLVSLRLPDTQSAGRVAALLGVLAPSLALIALMPCYDPPTPAHASTVSAYVARLDSALLQGSDAASGLGAWLSSDCVAALAAVLTSPQLVSVHDQALLALADLLYYSASFEARMPWAIRRLASTGDPPGQAMRHEMLRSLLAALHQGASGPPVCLETAELAAAQVAAESDAKRRRALLRVALQPAMAVETSKMFGDSAKPLPRSRLPTSGERDVSESWSNKKGTQVHGSVLDDDEHFDLGLLMP